MYHSISTVADGPLRSLAVPATLLRAQLTALVEAGYRLVGLSELIDLRRSGVIEPLVGLTFDDGYRDFLERAVPVLTELGASATMYHAVGHTGERASWLGPRAAEFPPVMDWPEVREVAMAGIEVGNHSLIHHPLDVLPPGQLGREVRDSRDLLSQELGGPVRSFCYPHGYHSASVRAAVATSGHENACAIGRRLYRPGDDPLAVPRLQPTPDHQGPDLVRLVRTGGPKLTSTIKAVAQPGWRVTRQAAARLGVRLT
jgi:peptidoglycan/xylan/chitin deacetylase (PgdA/CDA1 family)